MDPSVSDDVQVYQLRFPFQLHEMLQDSQKKGFEDVISWLPCGTAFKIHNQALFQKDILPAYFSMKKYKSFQRQLHWYTFHRATRGFNNETYCHRYFNREMRHLCQFITRKKKAAGGDSPVNKEQKTAKKNIQNDDSHVKKEASQDVPLEGLEPWVFSELGCFGVSLHQATQNADTNNNNNNEDSSSISSNILLPSVPSQAQRSGCTLPSLVAWEHAGEIMGGFLETSVFTNKTAKETNCISLRSAPVTRLNCDKNWMKAHEMSLLDCAFQFVGTSKPEEGFSRDEIIDELISTFPSEGKGDYESALGSGVGLFQTGYGLHHSPVGLEMVESARVLL